MSITDSFTSTCFEHPKNEKNDNPSEKNTSETNEKKKQKKKKEDNYKETTNRHNKNRNNKNKTNVYKTEWLSMNTKSKHKHLVEVSSFSGAKISCITDHVKLTLGDVNPDHSILHAGTNNLRTKNTASQIAKATIDLATSLKNDDNTVTVSGIVPRLDDLNNKANEVNRRLVLMCKERNISFLSHDESIDPSKHLNESKLHLNSNGIKIFAENFSRFLVKLN